MAYNKEYHAKYYQDHKMDRKEYYKEYNANRNLHRKPNKTRFVDNIENHQDFVERLFELLTDREYHVCALLMMGLNGRKIAEHLEFNSSYTYKIINQIKTKAILFMETYNNATNPENTEQGD